MQCFDDDLDVMNVVAIGDAIQWRETLLLNMDLLARRDWRRELGSRGKRGLSIRLHVEAGRKEQGEAREGNKAAQLHMKAQQRGNEARHSAACGCFAYAQVPLLLRMVST